MNVTGAAAGECRRMANEDDHHSTVIREAPLRKSIGIFQFYHEADLSSHAIACDCVHVCTHTETHVQPVKKARRQLRTQEVFLVFFFSLASALERSCGNISPIDVWTIACFHLVLKPVSILYEHQKNHDSLQLHSWWKRKDVSRLFSRMPIKGHVHSQKKKGKREETFVRSGLRHSSWLLTQFVLLQAKFCHDDDLKCAPSALSAFCNGQWDFEL